MGVPKSKHRALTRRPVRPARLRSKLTAAQRAAAEMRGDVEAYDKAMADRAARGNPPGISWEEAERQLDLLK